MLHSVRTRLIFNSLLITTVTILVVGTVTLFLVSAYFTREEEDYLQEQAKTVAPFLGQALALTDAEGFQYIVGLTSFVSETRIRVLNHEREVLADSGERTGFVEAQTGIGEPLYEVYVDRYGRVRSAAATYRSFEQNSADPSSLVGALTSGLEADTQMTAISDTALEIPLLIGSETVGYVQLSEGPAVGTAITDSIRLALLGGGVFALIVALIVGLFSARQVTRPLVALGDASEKVGSGELAARVPATRLAEFDRLGGQFNVMAERLSGTIERLETERAVLRRLIADASHELRTPLTALKTFNELLLEEVTELPANAFVQESTRQIDQLDQLTTGLLDLSRLEARLSGTNFVEADLRPVVAEAVRLSRSAADAKSQSLSLDLPDEPLIYPHDPSALQQAVVNLVQNAIKYTHNKGRVTVSIAQTQAEIEIVVSDNGKGITQNSLPHIFDRFYRGPEESADGNGLGLSITQEIVGIHDGTITCDSTVGAGSTFAIQLPLQNSEAGNHPALQLL